MGCIKYLDILSSTGATASTGGDVELAVVNSSPLHYYERPESQVREETATIAEYHWCRARRRMRCARCLERDDSW